MLHLYHSNRVEILFEHLLGFVEEPQEDPFVPELIVVPHPGLGRWLSQQIAERSGIACNLDACLPAAFVWRMFRLWMRDLPLQSPLAKEPLRWRLYSRLPDLLDHPAFTEQRRYLEDDRTGIKRYQLSQRLAGLFDQYLVYRPEMILDWERGKDEHWQAQLWRRVLADTPGWHWARVSQHFFSLIERGVTPSTAPPRRVSLFAVQGLSPSFLKVLEALSRPLDLHLFLLNPCREYWMDILDDQGKQRRRARGLRQGKEDWLIPLLDLGNPLLASMGQAGQAFFDQLLEMPALEREDFVDPGAGTLLARLQQDILELRDPRRSDPAERIPLAADDLSLQVHSCHSPLREVQVLLDQLLRLFERLPGLEPRDILVMAPDIDLYAPYVEVVFSAAKDRWSIPWTIADRKVGVDQPLATTVLALLDLPANRLEASAVLSLLEVPAVQRRFGLETAGLERIRAWVRDSGIRWGGDGTMRAELGLPAENANTWDFGLARLFLGLALPTGAGLWQGVLPWSEVEGGEAADLGALQWLLDRLLAWRRELDQPLPASGWQERIQRLLTDFFDPDEAEEALLSVLRQALGDLLEQAGRAQLDEPLGLAVIQAVLGSALEQIPGARHFLAGGVNFCSLVPLRSLPFRVIALLGLNDRDFPRHPHAPAFDLIARQPRRGDRSLRLEDRYLFLETLISARDSLILSYVGRDIRDNSPKLPSAVVSELLDAVQRSYVTEDGGEILSRICREHPLQPFSRRYFEPDSGLFSYSREWWQAARAELEGQNPAFVVESLPRPENSPTEVELEDLVRFFQSPAKAFLQERLGLRLAAEEAALSDTEPFRLEGLEKYSLKQELLAELRSGAGPEKVLTPLRAAGLLPHGVMGELELRQHTRTVQGFLARWQALGGQAQEPLEIDLALGKWRLRGRLEGLMERGLVTWRLGRLSAKDRLRLWARHLVLNVAAPRDIEPHSLHLAEQQDFRLEPVNRAEDLLLDLIELREKGLQRPLPFFPETSLLYVRAGGLTNEVWTAWNGRHNPLAESALPEVKIAFRGTEPLDATFFALALRLWSPLLQVGDEIKVD